MRNVLLKHHKKAVLVALAIILTAVAPVDPATILGLLEAAFLVD